jgi:hypothetical protein
MIEQPCAVATRRNNQPLMSVNVKVDVHWKIFQQQQHQQFKPQTPIGNLVLPITIAPQQFIQ